MLPLDQSLSASVTAPAGTFRKANLSLGFTRLQAGVFLHTDDQWSLAYFNCDDLHCVERELFG